MRLFVLIALILIAVPHDSIFAASDGTIVQVSRKLRMSRNDPVPPQEFYLNIGKRDGLKLGDRLNTYRSLPVVNVLVGEPWDFVKVDLAELRVFLLGESTSVARVVRMKPSTELPGMEHPFIMVGDRVSQNKFRTVIK